MAGSYTPVHSSYSITSTASEKEDVNVADPVARSIDVDGS